tara:strand:+ start:1135 stop:1428 length:294 start_codon:yes stop_codon:yes gene_type:complete
MLQTDHIDSDTDQKTLDGLVVKQAVRDVASKHPKLSNEALLYFMSDDFSNLCKRNDIQSDGIVEAIKELNTYPVLSKKKLAEDVCDIVDKYFDIYSK